MFYDKMETPATPERVYAICKLVEKTALSSNKLKEMLEPEYLHNNQAYFNDYKNAALELGLITASDHLLTLNVEPSVISSPQQMRKYINGKIDQFSSGKFYKITKEIFSLSDGLFREKPNIADLYPLMNDKTGLRLRADDMRAWRFWASFLGLGYLHGSNRMSFIPNPHVFVLDLIENAGLERGRRYSFSEMMQALQPSINMVVDPVNHPRDLNYGVSSALRLLHDMKHIELEHALDSHDIWRLYPMYSHTIRDHVTNITIV